MRTRDDLAMPGTLVARRSLPVIGPPTPGSQVLVVLPFLTARS